MITCLILALLSLTNKTKAMKTILTICALLFCLTGSIDAQRAAFSSETRAFPSDDKIWARSYPSMNLFWVSGPRAEAYRYEIIFDTGRIYRTSWNQSFWTIYIWPDGATKATVRRGRRIGRGFIYYGEMVLEK